MTDQNFTADSIASSIFRDGAKETYLSASPKEQIEMIEAYMLDNIKKVKSIQSLYLTNEEFKASFRKIIFSQVKSRLTHPAFVKYFEDRIQTS